MIVGIVLDKTGKKSSREWNKNSDS